MNLKDLKQTKISELINLGKELGLEEIGGMRRQDLIFNILKATAAQKKPFLVKGFLKFCRMGLVFYALPMPTICQVRMIFTSLRLRFAVLPCVPVILWPGKFVHPKKGNVTSLC